MLITILTGLIIIICWLMAKYNKSDNLFFILLVSLLAGMAGGAMISKLNKENAKKNMTNITQVYNPTQVSPAISIDSIALPGDAVAFKAKPVSKDYGIPAIGSSVSAPSKLFGEIRGQPTNYPLNKGGPMIPFDTS